MLLPIVSHRSRAIFFMVGALVFYCFWLWLLSALGWVSKATTHRLVVFWLLLPLIPVGGFDVWMRITWRQAQVTLYPSPPALLARLLERAYGLYWFPVIICIPLWIWSAVMTGWVLSEWVKSGG
jgi:hypothetical protein